MIFSTEEEVGATYEPLLAYQSSRPNVTVPHGFDREVAAVLPALWYCLHLPSSFLDTIDLPARALKARQRFIGGHQILLAPLPAFDGHHLDEWSGSVTPVLVIAPDEHLEEAAERSRDLGFAFDPSGVSELSDDTLQSHWRQIHGRFVSSRPYLGRPPTLSRRLDIAPVDLPEKHLARQFAHTLEPGSRTEADMAALVKEAMWHQTVLAATARLEQEGATIQKAQDSFEQVLNEERKNLRIPVALGFPGVASTYIKKAYVPELRPRIRAMQRLDPADTWGPSVGDRPDQLIERATIEFVVTHRAVASGGIGLMAREMPATAFTNLAELEAHFDRSPAGRAKAWQLLDDLDAVARPLWEDDVVAAVQRASSLSIFSNFPVGLLRLLGDTAPLSCRVPIAYRPLNPLTRSLQYELSGPPALDLSSRFRVLVAECISPDDPVGQLSRVGWNMAVEMFSAAEAGGSLKHVSTPSISALRTEIEREQPDILVISAHGYVDPSRHLAGLMIGDEGSVGPGLGPLPPVVILSACHVSPRGTGAISVADMLLREGAWAVLGTQVPVDVRRNATLMMRFFVYMAEVLAGRESHTTLLDVWHRVQSSNAVNDILSATERSQVWATSTTRSGRPVLKEFMDVRSRGRLRKGHVYRDSEELLTEIADEEGVGAWMRAWLRSPGYLPESAFYVFVGRPDHVYLRPPEF